MSIKSYYKKILGRTKDTYLKNPLTLLPEPEINDGVYDDFEFGAEGLSGIMGTRKNRMNIHAVKKSMHL